MGPVLASILTFTYLFGKGFADEASRDAYRALKNLFTGRGTDVGQALEDLEVATEISVEPLNSLLEETDAQNDPNIIQAANGLYNHLLVGSQRSIVRVHVSADGRFSDEAGNFSIGMASIIDGGDAGRLDLLFAEDFADTNYEVWLTSIHGRAEVFNKNVGGISISASGAFGMLLIGTPAP